MIAPCAFFRGLLGLLKIFLLAITYPVRRLLPKARKDVSGEVVLVTGGGLGIGRHLALEFAKRDASVVLWDINETAMQEVVSEIKKLGKRRSVYTYVVDVSNRDDVYKNADKVRQDVGNVTILVNNAGILNGKPLLETEDDRIDLLLNVNTVAHFWTVKAFLPSMMEHDHGHIVTMASLAGLVAGGGLVDYACSKFGAVGFHNSVALELAAQRKTGIKTTLFCPYIVKTQMTNNFEDAGKRTEWILPRLDVQLTAKKMMDAILTNQHFVVMPSRVYYATLLLNFLPMEIALMLAEYFGAFSTDRVIERGRQHAKRD